jgi:hypothetical protein
LAPKKVDDAPPLAEESKEDLSVDDLGIKKEVDDENSSQMETEH